MRCHEIRDLNIVADTGSIPCRIIGAEDFETGAESKRRLHRDLDEMGGLRSRLTETSLRVGPCDVEITQDRIFEAVGLAGIPQHPFGHQLGAPIGIDRRQRNRFSDRVDFGLAIDRRGRRKNKMLDLVAHRAFEEVARLGGIVEIITQRICDRFRYYDLGGEMRDSVDFMLPENGFHERHIAKIADDEFRWGPHRGTEAGRKIVENDGLFARVEERQHHMSADVARSASYENRHAVTPNGNPFVNLAHLGESYSGLIFACRHVRRRIIQIRINSISYQTQR